LQFPSIEDAVRRKVDFSSIHVYDEIDSTHEQLKKLPKSPSLVIADSQLQGKGRADKVWVADKGANILLSCSWFYEKAPKDLSGLSLALAVVLTELLNEEYNIDLKLKWPNDILFQNKKVAGILLDISVGQKCSLYAGLGLNVLQPQVLDSQIDQPWTDLYSMGVRNVNRNELIGRIYSAWLTVFLEYSEKGFGHYRERWNAMSQHINKEVRLIPKQAEKETIRGVLHGVDDLGRLCVCNYDKITTITDSDYSLREIVRRI
jgi:BirA family biotin operon repressor/biotin-[acetyl-CoA-carboxylase] ligase